MQAGSSAILKKMNRRYDKEKYLQLVADLKNAVPYILLSTDIIVGFPGETEDDFRDTLDVVEQVEYGSAFMFKHSIRSGTKAADMENQVDEKIKSKRLQELIRLQETYTKKTAERFIGKVVEVLVESDNSQGRNAIGKTSQNLPVALQNDEKIKQGEIINVEIREIKSHTLIGTIYRK